MSIIFGGKKKKKADEVEEEATTEEGLPEPVIGKPSAKAKAAHAKRFGTSIPTVMGPGKSGFGELGPQYGGTRGPGMYALPSAGAAVSGAVSTPMSAGVSPTAAPTYSPTGGVRSISSRRRLMR